MKQDSEIKAEIGVVILTPHRDPDTFSRTVAKNIGQQMRLVHEELDLKCKWELLGGFSHIPLARTVLVNSALRDYPNATRFVFWDADQVIMGPNGLSRLVAHDADVVGTLVVSRSRAVRLQTRLHPLPSPPDDAVRYDGPPVLIELEPGTDQENPKHRGVTGFGLISVSRETFAKVTNHYNLRPLWFDDMEVRHFFADFNAMLDGKDLLFSEDYGFCIKARSAGCRVFVDPTILVGHQGRYFYSLADVGLIENEHRTDIPASLELRPDAENDEGEN